MRGISDKIEAFISELLKNENDEWLELKRNELAAVFNCVPSQINYVISTRFGPDNGYIVESRRGGGGYLRIKRIASQPDDLLANAIQSVGNSIDYSSAQALISRLADAGAADEKTARLMLSAICDRSIPAAQPLRNTVRAGILKGMLSQTAADLQKGLI